MDRPTVHNSVAPISPIINDDDDIERSVVLTTPTPKAGTSRSAPASQIASKPRYQAPATTKSSVKKKSSLASVDTFRVINTFFESKAKLTQEQLRRFKTESATSMQSQQLQELQTILNSNIDELTCEVVNEKICRIISNY